MLLAEELALVALNPASGRHAVGVRSQLNACLAGDVAARDSVVERLRAAAVTDGVLDGRTALVLSMTGPAHLLEVVAPRRPDRRHARDRIDHALDSTEFEPVGNVVRRLIAEAAAAAAAGAAAAVVVATSG